MVDAKSAGGPLSDEDVRHLARLLARYAEHELDQFDHWRVEVPNWGAVFVEMTLEPRTDVSKSIFTTIWPLPPHLA